MKRILWIILAGCFLLVMAACTGADGNDCGTNCDGNIDDSVFLNCVDDTTGEEICCPTQVLINSHVSTDGGTGLGHDDCICTWREDNRKAFFVETEDSLRLMENNLIRIEMDGYLSWEEEVYVPCVCVPMIKRTVRLTPEQ